MKREHDNAEERIKKDWRFERGLRLFGPAAMTKLAESHVAVFGLGGVGSYAVEGLARSGVGRLTIVDFDLVCVTNINRQLQALSSTVGQSKAELLAERVRAINPKADVRPLRRFYNAESSAELLDPRPDVVVDCIDNVTAKMHLVATCVGQDIPIIATLGAGARLDPTRVSVVRLTETHSDPLGRALRKFIRRRHKVSDEQMAKVIAVFSDEEIRKPITDHGGVVCGHDCVCPGANNGLHTCDKRNVIYGTAVFVTSAFGMAAASAAVRLLTGMNPFSPELACDHCGAAIEPKPSVEERRKHKNAARRMF
jgi:tRNA A37 threonylcarbamoyladenosine dehydratase